MSKGIANRQLFGQLIRMIRKSSGWPLGVVARDIAVDESTILKWERGERLPPSETVSVIERYFGVPWRIIEWIANISRDAGEPIGSLLENEPLAEALRIWEPRSIPGQLQTRNYAGVWLKDEQAVEDRMARRSALFERDSPADVRVILSEGAIRTIFGSVETTREQLEFLIAEDSPWILHVFPFEVPLPPAAAAGPVTLLDVSEETLIYVEAWRLQGILDGTAAVREAWHAWDHLLGLALSPGQSKDMIKSVIGALE